MKNTYLSHQLEKVFGCVALLMVALMVFIPGATSAYAVLDQSVTQLAADTYLFKIDYRLNYMNYDTFAPIFTEQTNAMSTTSSPLLHYSLVNEAGKIVPNIKNASIVLSTADRVGNQYYFADKDSSPFSLISIVRLSPAQLAAGGSLALQIDWLPFTITKADEVNNTAVHKESLVDFKTPAVTW